MLAANISFIRVVIFWIIQPVAISAWTTFAITRITGCVRHFSISIWTTRLWNKKIKIDIILYLYSTWLWTAESQVSIDVGTGMTICIRWTFLHQFYFAILHIFSSDIAMFSMTKYWVFFFWFRRPCVIAQLPMPRAIFWAIQRIFCKANHLLQYFPNIFYKVI